MNKEKLKLAGVRCEYIDTHTHTKVKGSDGKLTPIEQVSYALDTAYENFKKELFSVEKVSDYVARELFYECVDIHWAITDHNTTSAFSELRRNANILPKNFHLHMGTELEVLDAKNNIFDVTIVGISDDFSSSIIGKHYLDNVVAMKNDLEDISAIIQYLAFKNIGIILPELLDESLSYKVTGKRANDLAHDIMQYRLFENSPKTEAEKQAKEYLIKHGYEGNRKSYYRRFVTNSDSIFYVDQTMGRKKLEEVALNVLKDEPKSLIFVSHPGIYEEKKYGKMEDFIMEKYGIFEKVRKILWCTYKLDISRRVGFECGHRGMTLSQTKWVKEFCQRSNLIYSSGSDFHESLYNYPFRIANNKIFITRDLVSDEWFKTPTFKF